MKGRRAKRKRVRLVLQHSTSTPKRSAIIVEDGDIFPRTVMGSQMVKDSSLIMVMVVEAIQVMVVVSRMVVVLASQTMVMVMVMESLVIIPS
jgi:hypothetical protein